MTDLLFDLIKMLSWGLCGSFTVIGTVNIARAFRNEVARGYEGRPGLEVLLSAACIGVGIFFGVGAYLAR